MRYDSPEQFESKKQLCMYTYMYRYFNSCGDIHVRVYCIYRTVLLLVGINTCFTCCIHMYSTCTCIYSMCILAQVYGAPDLYLHLQVHFEGVEQSQEDGERQLHNLRHAGDTVL